MTASIAGGATDVWTEIVVRFMDELPAYPDTTVIPPPRISAPPLLTGSDMAEWCVQLLVAYSATAAHFFDVRYSAGFKHHDDIGPRDLAKLKTIVSLQKVAVFMHAHKIRPHVWCAVSARSWVITAQPRMRHVRPPIAWVYRLKRLQDFMWLYEPADQAARGNRLRLVPTHLELLRRYETMRVRLIARARVCKRKGIPLTAEHVQEVVARTLPSRVYRELVHRAQRESRERQADLRSAFDRGDYLWG